MFSHGPFLRVGNFFYRRNTVILLVLGSKPRPYDSQRLKSI